MVLTPLRVTQKPKLKDISHKKYGATYFPKISKKIMGVINSYNYMWPRQVYTLAALTKLTSMNRKFKWTKVEQYNFDKIKRIVAHDTLSTYPYFNETFQIHTDASAFQLGVVIVQNGKPIVFYIIKLTDTQQRYTVTERKILSIVETLKNFRTI